jgi:callose synthase
LVLLSIQWIPHFLVFLIDLSIWYSVWSAMVGAYSALTTRQGAVRDMLGLREHFMRAPHAFCQRIMPPTSSVGVLASKNSPSQSDVTVIDTATSVKKKLAPPPTTMKLGKKGMSSNDLLSYQNSSGSGNGGGGSSSDETKSMQERIEGTDGRLTEYLDVRTQRWVAFAKVWNGMLNNLRNSDHLSDSELESYEFNKYEWASKPIYLPSFQTVALVERSVQGLILSSIAYHNEKVPEKKLLIWEKFIGSMSVTAQEGVSEAWELTTWSLEKLLGRMHAGDIIHIFQSMEKWSTSDDLYSKFDPSLVPSIINQISNITSTLKGCIIKRRKNPLVTEERRSGGAVVGHGSVSRTSSDGSGGGGGGGGGGSGSMKRSVSSGFLKSIANQQHHDQPEAATAPKIRFAKLEPFRKNFVLHDNVRDKIRDELRNLLNTLRTALKDKVALSAEAKDLVDRITFMLSMENG